MVLLAAAGFGTIAVFGKFGFDVGLNNPTMLGFRFLLASVVLLAFIGITGKAEVLQGRQLYAAIGLGLAYAVLTALFFWGLVYITAGLAVITLYVYPVWVYFISVTLLGEQLTRLKLIAIVVAMGGVIAIVGVDIDAIDVRGIALVLGASVAYAIYTTGNRVVVADIDADVLATFAMTVCGVFFLGYGSATNTLFIPASLEQWGVILGLALVGTAAPIALFVHGLELVEASRASVLTLAEPPVAVILGILLLGEVLTLGVVIGGSMVLLGVLMIQRDRTTTRPAAGLPPDDGG